MINATKISDLKKAILKKMKFMRSKTAEKKDKKQNNKILEVKMIFQIRSKIFPRFLTFKKKIHSTE